MLLVNNVYIEPHPDDLFLGAFQFMRIQKRLRPGLWIQVTNGEKDFTTGKIDLQLAQRRSTENENYARHIGATIHKLNFPDGGVDAQNLALRIDLLLLELGLYSKHCNCICPAMSDRHKDHKESYLAAISFPWFNLYEYCIDTPDDIDLQYCDEAPIKVEEGKRAMFEYLYPTQYKSLIESKHPALMPRLNDREIIILRRSA